MTIQIGERIPEVVLKRIRGGVESVDTPSLFEGRKVVLFAVPGAFTPTCSEKHLPGFIARFDDKGIEPAYVTFGLDAEGKVERITMKAVSPTADFSFDYHDLNFTPVASAAR